ncbi:MAG: lytic transglycosylase domain-containing protein [Myxococcales bacterium]|jgi:soluble lytic murein transglycosylase-like protein|nr:lytic transglycosylase domain-containing protein [Myxococcales bacterium]
MRFVFHTPTLLLACVSALIAAACGAPAAPRHTTPSAAPQTQTPGQRPAVRLDPSEETIALKGNQSPAAAQSKENTDKRMQGWDVTAEKVQAVADIVRRAAAQNGIGADLIYGVIWVESRFNPKAVSPVGAQGLMQLMPKTAEYLAGLISWSGKYDAFDPEFNIAAGSYYIARLIKQFDGDLDLALAAYNAGPTNIRRWMNNTGLPKVSIEYYTMVQTARHYFGGDAQGPGATHSSGTAVAEAVIPTSAALDRLGLAILISGYSLNAVGRDRPNEIEPLN